MGKVKASYNADRLRLGEQLPLNTPLSVIADISERCNFRCNYCFRSGEKDESWSYAAKNNLMTMEIFETVVKQLSEFPQKIKVVSLSGHGEPLCNPYAAQMARRLKESEKIERVEMHTNASLLTEKNVAEIAKAGFARIVVSLQGLDASTYERVCGVKIHWERFYNCLRLLYENRRSDLKIHIKISEAALDKNNYDAEKEKFYLLFGDIADSVFIEKVTPLWKNMKVGAEGTENKFGQDYGEIKYCPIAFYKIWVAPDGELYPCTGLPAPMSLGNIRKISLRDAWTGSERLEFLKEHLQLGRCGNPFCRDCFVPVNTVTSEKDLIDPYKEEILKRLEEQF